MSKLIYAKSKAGFELAYTDRGTTSSIYRSIAFLEDGYLWTHGNYFRIFTGENAFTASVTNNAVTIKDPSGNTFVEFDRGIHAISGTAPITATTTNGATTISHANSNLAASTLGATADSADSIVVPKIVTDVRGHLISGTSQFTATLNQVKTTAVASGADQYITFAVAATTGTSELNKATTLKFNPTTGTLAANNLSGKLSNSLTIKLNGADTVFDNSTSRNISIFSPVNAGSTGQILQNVGGTPTWVSLSQGVSSASTHTEIPTAQAVYSAISAGLGANDAMIFKGVIDASANPNYPAGNSGETYKISKAGNIGGASGPKVEIGDIIICITDNSVAGTHATVGNNWTIVQADIDGAVTYTTPDTPTIVGHLPIFSTTNGVGLTTSGALLSAFGKALVAASPAANTILGVGASNTVTSYSTSGTGTTLALTTSPVFVTPTLGAATATSINKVTITAPATSATLTIANGKTLKANNSVTFSGTDNSTISFGTGGTVAYTANKLSVFAATTSAELAGVISDETGTGKVVFNTSPTFIGDVTFGTSAPAHDTIVISPNTTGTAAFTGTLTSQDLTEARTWTLPNNTGTIALTTDTSETAANIAGGLAGDLLYQSGPNVTAKLPGSVGKILTFVGTAPKWTDRDSIVFAANATAKANGSPTGNKIFLNLFDSENSTPRNSLSLEVAGSLAMTGSAGAITITGTNTWRNVSAYKLSNNTLAEVLNTTIGGSDLQFGNEFLWDETNAGDPELKLAWAEVNTAGVVTYAV